MSVGEKMKTTKEIYDDVAQYTQEERCKICKCDFDHCKCYRGK
jgi:hypothetical protein